MEINKLKSIEEIINKLNEFNIPYIIKTKDNGVISYFDVEIEFKYNNCNQLIVFSPNNKKEKIIDVYIEINNESSRKHKELSYLRFLEMLHIIKDILDAISKVNTKLNVISNFVVDDNMISIYDTN